MYKKTKYILRGRAIDSIDKLTFIHLMQLRLFIMTVQNRSAKQTYRHDQKSYKR